MVKPFSKSTPRLPVSGLLAALTLMAIPLKADILYNTFGPGGTYDPSVSPTVIWNYSPGGRPRDQYGNGQAYAFTLSQDSKLTSLTLELEEDTRRNIALSVRSDNSGAPGNVLETITTIPANLTNSAQAVTFQSSLQPLLSASQTYWLVLEPSTLDTSTDSNNCTYLWWRGLTGYQQVADRLFDFDQNIWGPWRVDTFLPAAFRVDGFVVPEPSSISLEVIGLGLAARRYRGRKS